MVRFDRYSLFLLLTYLSLVSGEDAADAGPQQALPQRAFNKPSKRSGGGPSVTWQSGDNSGAHASAPRSQKYWKEHGLDQNRPDYAKTDAEVWAERWGGSGGGGGGGGGGSWLRWARTAVTVLVGCGFLLSAFSSLSSAGQLYSMASGGGAVGGAPATPEQQRAARLARFGGAESPAGADSSSTSSTSKSPSSSSKSGAGAYQRAMAEAMGTNVD